MPGTDLGSLDSREKRRCSPLIGGKSHSVFQLWRKIHLHAASLAGEHSGTGSDESPLYISRIVRANNKSRRGLVGQPLLAVRFRPAGIVRDSQEWLSYKNANRLNANHSR